MGPVTAYYKLLKYDVLEYVQTTRRISSRGDRGSGGEASGHNEERQRERLYGVRPLSPYAPQQQRPENSPEQAPFGGNPQTRRPPAWLSLPAPGAWTLHHNGRGFGGTSVVHQQQVAWIIPLRDPPASSRVCDDLGASPSA
ncbi:hypothetical protein EYF80_013814 [Liparis tanakae]|uniref:Uncharacterized protein n=1 Tax=Liparis tanakae TaxID=230148 RepID=A0A4Z2IE66_9TELE|nr:hypothetical protein EYF80_013814 [Liparis tanakae]